MGGWVGGGGWPEQMGIRLTSASTRVGVEVAAELGNNNYNNNKDLRKQPKQSQNNTIG